MSKKFGLKFFCALLATLFLTTGVLVPAASAQSSIYKTLETPFYDPLSGGDSCSGSSTLTGSDSEQKTWNYFISRSLSEAQTAGIMGNIEQESHFNPLVMQIGGESKDPYSAGELGWGIIQWSGNNGPRSTGDKVTSLYGASGLSGPIYELATQLELVWGHMQNHPPITRGDFSLDDFKKITDEKQAALYFTYHIEAGTDPGGVREDNAHDILLKYGGGSTLSSGGGCGSSSISPDCQNASTTAKILCAAQAYDSVSYSETFDAGHQGAAAWHKACPAIGPSCILDCSGLVNIAVYDVFKADLQEVTTTEAADTQYWQHIPFDKLQPGDLIQPNSGHVEIVDHVQGDTIYTFGAHSANRPQPDQVSPAVFAQSSGDLYLHYIGPGS